MSEIVKLKEKIAALLAQFKAMREKISYQQLLIKGSKTDGGKVNASAPKEPLSGIEKMRLEANDHRRALEKLREGVMEGRRKQAKRFAEIEAMTDLSKKKTALVAYQEKSKSYGATLGEMSLPHIEEALQVFREQEKKLKGSKSAEAAKHLLELSGWIAEAEAFKKDASNAKAGGKLAGAFVEMTPQATALRQAEAKEALSKKIQDAGEITRFKYKAFFEEFAAEAIELFIRAHQARIKQIGGAGLADGGKSIFAEFRASVADAVASTKGTLKANEGKDKSVSPIQFVESQVYKICKNSKDDYFQNILKAGAGVLTAALTQIQSLVDSKYPMLKLPIKKIGAED